MDPVMGMVDITLVDIRVPVIIIDIQFTHLEEDTTTLYTTHTDQALTSTFLVNQFHLSVVPQLAGRKLIRVVFFLLNSMEIHTIPAHMIGQALLVVKLGVLRQQIVTDSTSADHGELVAPTAL